MKLLTKEQIDRLARNGRANAERIEDDGNTHDFEPVVKLFMPDGAATWLLTETDPEDPDIAFGLCDLGMGCPELGTVRLSELESVRGRHGPSDRARPSLHADRPPVGLRRQGPHSGEDRGMSTNIRPDHVSAFEALTSGEHRNFALFSCFVNGTPASAIVAITPPAEETGEYIITPLFVSVTPDMALTDHAGTPAGGVA